MVKRRRYLDSLSLFLGKPIIKVLTGMRRVGKSTILNMIRDELLAKGSVPEQIIYINMEFMAFDTIRNYQDLYRYVKELTVSASGFCTIMIDEVQEIDGWEKAITSFLAENMGDIIITGSNAHLLSSELATFLTGRYIEIPVYPLSFAEFLEFRNVSLSSPEVRDEFKLYLKYGGLPGIHFMPLQDEAIYPYLSSILNTILFKDIIKRHQIRDAAQLERVIAFVLDNCGTITTAKSISNYFKSQKLKTSVDSVINFLFYLEESYLVHKAARYDIKGKRTLELYEKYYPGDTGLQHGITGYKEKNIAGELENVVYLELLRRGFSVTVGTLDGAEIDFIAEKQNERHYFQVAYLMVDDSTIQREFGNLEKIQDQYPKTVISMDEVFPSDRNGIKRIHIIDFLLGR